MAYGAIPKPNPGLILGIRELLRKRKMSPELDNSVIDQGMLPDQEKYTMNAGASNGGGLAGMLRQPEPPMPPMFAAPPPVPNVVASNQLPETSTPSPAPRTRADYFADIPDFRTAPAFNAPIRNVEAENNDSLLGGGLAALIAAVTGRGRFAGQAMRGYVGGARQAQDKNYQNTYRQAENANAARVQGVDAFDQNVQRQRVEAGQRYDDDQTALNRASMERNRELVETGRVNDDQAAFLNGLSMLSPEAREARIRLTPPATLSRLGFKSDGSDILARVGDLNRANYKSPESQAEAQRIKNLTAEAQTLTKRLTDPYVDNAGKMAAVQRLEEIKKYTGIGIGGAATVGANMTASQKASLGQGERRIGISEGNQEIARAGLNLRRESVAQGWARIGQGVQRIEQTDRAYSAMLQNRNEATERSLSGMVRMLEKDTNGYRKERRDLQQAITATEAIIRSGVEGKDKLTPERRAELQGLVSDARGQASELQRTIDASTSRLNTYRETLRQKNPAMGTGPMPVTSGGSVLPAITPTTRTDGGYPAQRFLPNALPPSKRLDGVRAVPNGPGRPAQYRAPDGKYTKPVQRGNGVPQRRAAAKPSTSKTNRVSVNGRGFTITEVD